MTRAGQKENVAMMRFTNIARRHDGKGLPLGSMSTMLVLPYGSCLWACVLGPHTGLLPVAAVPRQACSTACHAIPKWVDVVLSCGVVSWTMRPGCAFRGTVSNSTSGGIRYFDAAVRGVSCSVTGTGRCISGSAESAL